jgi:hypothetical protein
MYFCIRDDDTSFFTSPEELEHVYGEVSRWGPISLAVVPFHRAGTSKAVPDKFRGRWSTHPLHENQPLVDYLRKGVSAGRFEIMLHGYHHDEPDGRLEFARGAHLAQRITHGRTYLEDLLGTTIRVFVPPRNAIGRQGLRAIARACLHLGGTAGIRAGWSPFSRKAWPLWLRLRRWRQSGGLGVPWILDLGDHREISANAVTPTARLQHNEAVFQSTLAMGGVFCVATHYWEQAAPSLHAGDPTVGEHLQRLIHRAAADPRIVWRSVGEVVSESPVVA